MTKIPLKVFYKCPYADDFFDYDNLWLYSDRFCHEVECNYIFACDTFENLEGKDTFKTKDFRIDYNKDTGVAMERVNHYDFVTIEDKVKNKRDDKNE